VTLLTTLSGRAVATGRCPFQIWSRATLAYLRSLQEGELSSLKNPEASSVCDVSTNTTSARCSFIRISKAASEARPHKGDETVKFPDIAQGTDRHSGYRIRFLLGLSDFPFVKLLQRTIDLGQAKPRHRNIELDIQFFDFQETLAEQSHVPVRML
jgi:hypothetical protein